MEPDKEDASSYEYQRHEVFSIGYYVRCSYDNSLSSYHFRRDENCIAWFSRQFNDLAHRVKDIISANVLMEALSKQQWEAYRSATRCHICEKPFAPDDTRVRDHCHLTGRYRGPAHQIVILIIKIHIIFQDPWGRPYKIVVKKLRPWSPPITESLDTPLLDDVVTTLFPARGREIREKGALLKKKKFIDSHKFLASSLEKLGSYLDKDKLKVVRSEFSTLSDEEFELLTRKGIFPYEYTDCVEKLQDTRLPSRELFFSSLTGDTVSESDYAHAVNVWQCHVRSRVQRFSIRTLGEYSDIELNTQFRTRAKNDFEKNLTFYDYMRCLNEEIEMTRRQSCIRSKLHEVYTISESKIALSPYNDK
ncbi:hypothetical protein ALC57_14204 [Trachymyrmex cornetzi]|uniref:Uncharacterized protein n=1 Tax=Trachymyrmex cornetzi TaxID=471704 RepID=A0A151IYH6_9HYME|nr:hypothetical protein ALC57_14204 [Trachymyrmex cornetzi]